MDILIGALVSLAGVVVGGALQYFTSHKAISRQHEWERAKLVHDKLEHVAAVARDVANGMYTLYFSGIACVEAQQRYVPGCSMPLAELAMLLKFYAPELEHHYDDFIALRDRMSDTVADLISARLPSEKPQRQKLNERLIKASFEATRIGDALIQEASTVGRKQLGESA
ncbi:MAG TPA: hypothetical protein VFQ88_09035 [Nevskiaceae bacterium]|nr:hypothetical protein [Nevskiaceae bacterium]